MSDATTARVPSTVVPNARRLISLDAARGVALFGMVMINLSVVRTDTVLDRVWTVPFGRASILFVVLAGVGVTLFLGARRAEARRWPVLAWRAAVFAVLGLSLQLLTPAVSVILPSYGLLFVGALLWHRLPDRALAIVIVGALVVGPVLFQVHQNPGQHETRMPTLLDPPGPLLHSLFLSGPYPLVVWVVPFLCGMWLGRRELRAQRVQRRLVVYGGGATVLALVAAQLAADLLGRSPDAGWGRLLTGAAHGQMPLWLVSSVGSAAFVIGAMMLLWPKVERWARPLAHVGQLAFTLYVAHFLVIAAIGGRIDSRVPGIAITVVLLAAFTVAATWWVRSKGTGPLERLLRGRWLTHTSRGTA